MNAAPPLRIALVDDDAERAAELAVAFRLLGHQVRACATADLAALPAGELCVVAGESVAALDRAVALRLRVIAIDAPATPGEPLACVRIVRPLHVDSLRAALDAARTPATGADAPALRGLVGQSTGMLAVRQMLARVADRDVTVLITGESGTGKEVVARALHDASPRASGPFVPVNCGAIPSELLESELFGHEKGAFTGAISARIGRFELADGGTLFLDEIGDLPLHMQVKILRAIQERCFERVGGTRTVRCDVRIVAATHKNLEQMIDAGTFRDDLYYRINVFPIEMPALRERLDDLPLLLDALVARLGDSGSVRFDATALHVMQQYGWPGNVRELANLVERMAILHPGATIAGTQLPARMHAGHAIDAPPPVALGAVRERVREHLLDPDAPPPLPVNGLDLRDYLNRLERSLIVQALDDTNSVVARAADRLHIRRTTLVEKMRKFGLTRDACLD